MLIENGFRDAMQVPCDTCPTRNLGMCGMTGELGRRIIAAKSRLSVFPAGKTIIAQGERSDRVGIIVAGKVKVAHVTEDGDEHVLDVLQQGDIVGDPMSSENLMACETATEVTLCWTPRAALDQLLRDHVELYRSYLAAALHQLEHQRLRAASLRGRSTLQRVALWLAGEAREGTSDTGEAVIQIALNRRDLSSLLDMTVETLCRCLHQLVQKKVIHMLAPDRIRVTDSARLRRVAKGEDDRVVRALNAPCCDRHPEMAGRQATT